MQYLKHVRNIFIIAFTNIACNENGNNLHADLLNCANHWRNNRPKKKTPSNWILLFTIETRLGEKKVVRLHKIIADAVDESQQTNNCSSSTRFQCKSKTNVNCDVFRWVFVDFSAPSFELCIIIYFRGEHFLYSDQIDIGFRPFTEIKIQGTFQRRSTKFQMHFRFFFLPPNLYERWMRTDCSARYLCVCLNVETSKPDSEHWSQQWIVGNN